MAKPKINLDKYNTKFNTTDAERRVNELVDEVIRLQGLVAKKNKTIRFYRQRELHRNEIHPFDRPL